VPLLPFVANETPLKEIYRVNQIFLISIKVLHTQVLPQGECMLEYIRGLHRRVEK
jgi:hypothetical protein